MATWVALPGTVRQLGQGLSLSLADPIPTPLAVSQPGSPLPFLYGHTVTKIMHMTAQGRVGMEGAPWQRKEGAPSQRESAAKELP